MAKFKSLRAMAVLCAIMVLFTALTPQTVYAETAAEKYKRLQQELAQISQQIEDYKSDRDKAVQLKRALEEQKALLDEMIAMKQKEIAETQALLEQKEKEVAAKREKLHQNEELFRQRMVAIYKQNDSNMLSSLLSVDSFSQLLDVIDMLKRVSKHDTELIAMLDQERQELEQQQAEIDALLQEQQAAYAELEENARILAENISAQNARISAADAQIQAQKEVYNDTHAQLVQAQKEMAAISQNLGGSNSSDGSQYVGGQFGWPVPNFYQISCYYGSPDPNGVAHRGIDIRGNGINGATIVAAGSGTVIVAGSAGNSYGNYVVIDHGAGVKTLYAHCSAVWVGVGATVQKGDGIAAVGATGFVTGYHLHFEVLVNNSPQNPMSYLK